ncbi:MAG: hypothetical protein JNK05_10445 [Myxococcales bacterium]|nr:hypothetical protein [Myxococcales bacterium]
MTASRGSSRRALCSFALIAAALASGCTPIVYGIVALRRATVSRDVVIDHPVTGDTRQPDARRAPTCARREARAHADQAWRFVATRDATFTAHVRATHDAIVAVYDGDRELLCEDDSAAVGEGRLRFIARRGQSVWIVVDGYRGERGPYELTVSRSE